MATGISPLADFSLLVKDFLAAQLARDRRAALRILVDQYAALQDATDALARRGLQGLDYARVLGAQEVVLSSDHEAARALMSPLAPLPPGEGQGEGACHRPPPREWEGRV